MNKRYVTIACIIIAFIIIVSVVVIVKENESKNDKLKFAIEYTDIGSDNLYDELTLKETLDFLKYGTGVILFGFPECNWCQEIVPIVNDVAKEQGIKKVYYYNIRDIRQNNTKEYQEIVKLLKDNLDVDENNNLKVYVPDVFVLKRGKVVAHNNDYSRLDGEADDYFTDSKKQEAKIKYESLLSEYKK